MATSITTEILRKWGAGEITTEEANKQLKENNSNVFVNPKKTGNAMIDDGLGGEVCTVKDGKVVGGGISETYTIFYDGKEWHTAADHETLVAGPGTPIILDRGTANLPERPVMSRRPDLAGRDDVEQKTKAGTYIMTYDDNGYCVKATKKS